MSAPVEVEIENVPKRIDDVKDLIIKAQCWVKKGDEERLAEILSIKSRRPPPKFYVHYVNYNKRLDEWVLPDRINLEKDVLLPVPKPAEESKTKQKNKKQTQLEKTIQSTTAPTKENTPEVSDMMDLDDLNVQGINTDDVSREDEIKKLRTSGSMTQNPHVVSQVRNLNKVVMGKYEIEPWYFSPYPIELTDQDQIYIDDFTLQYF